MKYLALLFLFIASCTYKNSDPIKDYPNSKQAEPIEGPVMERPVPVKEIPVIKEVPVEVKVPVPEIRYEKVEVPVDRPVPKLTVSSLYSIEITGDDLRYNVGEEGRGKIAIANLMPGKAKLSLESKSIPSGATLVAGSSLERSGEYFLQWNPPAKTLGPYENEKSIPASVELVISEIQIDDKDLLEQTLQALRGPASGCRESLSEFRCSRELTLTINRSLKRPEARIVGLADSVTLGHSYPFTVRVDAAGTDEASPPEVVFVETQNPGLQWGTEFVEISKNPEFKEEIGKSYWMFYFQINTQRAPPPKSYRLNSEGHAIINEAVSRMALNIGVRALSPSLGISSDVTVKQFDFVLPPLESAATPAAALSPIRPPEAPAKGQSPGVKL